MYKKRSSAHFSAVPSMLYQSSLTGYKAATHQPSASFLRGTSVLSHHNSSLAPSHWLWAEDIQGAPGRQKFPLQAQQHWWNHSIMTTGWRLKTSSDKSVHSSSGSAETSSFSSKIRGFSSKPWNTADALAHQNTEKSVLQRTSGRHLVQTPVQSKSSLKHRVGCSCPCSAEF